MKSPAKICLAVLVGAILLALLFMKLQKQSENACRQFLEDCIPDSEILAECHNLLDPVSADKLDKLLDEDFKVMKQELVERYRFHAYWTATLTGIAQAAVVVLLFIGIRRLLSKVHVVPLSIYRKLWPDEYETERKRRARRLPDTEEKG
jgi:hypothetical protein